MNKNKIIKILSIFGIVTILFIGSFIITGKIVKAQSFNNLVQSANQSFSLGKYDEAIDSYSKALELKDDNNVRQNIAIAKNYKQYQDVYNQGLKLMNDKKYSEAIQKLSSINQNLGQLYTNSQNKIEECKKNIISENITNANNAISNKDYDNANKYVEDILKIDVKNEQAIKLKDTIAKIQEQKNKDEIEQKQQIQNRNSQQSKVETSKINNNSSIQQNSIDEQMRILDYEIESSAKGSEKRRQLLQQKIDLLKQQERRLKNE